MLYKAIQTFESVEKSVQSLIIYHGRYLVRHFSLAGA